MFFSPRFCSGYQKGFYEGLDFAKKCAEFSVTPFMASYALISASGGGGGMFNFTPAINMLGWWTLPTSVFALIITLPLGLAAAATATIASPFWGLYTGFNHKEIQKMEEPSSNLKHA